MKRLLLFVCAITVAYGQNLYLSSDIIIDDSSGNVSVVASSSTDYNTAYYYDLYLQTQLNVQPEGGSSYTTCTFSVGTTGSSVSMPPCNLSLGSQSANFELWSFHSITTIYYYYQLQYCTWECSYWDDYYGYSLLGTSGTYEDNQYFYAPGIATPVAQQTSKSAMIVRNAQKGCFYPTGETTNGWGWNAANPYTAQFLQTYSGGNFNGRLITEYFPGSPVDHCWRTQNGGQPAANPSPGTWNVGYIKAMDYTGDAKFQYTMNNAWGYDHFGFYGPVGSTMLYNYVNNMRPTSSACTVDFYQYMYMYCGTGTHTGPGSYYTDGPMQLLIYGAPTSATLTSTRKGTSQVRPYP